MDGNLLSLTDFKFIQGVYLLSVLPRQIVYVETFTYLVMIKQHSYYCVGVPAGAFRLRNGSYPAIEVARRARRSSLLIS